MIASFVGSVRYTEAATDVLFPGIGVLDDDKKIEVGKLESKSSWITCLPAMPACPSKNLSSHAPPSLPYRSTGQGTYLVTCPPKTSCHGKKQ